MTHEFCASRAVAFLLLVAAGILSPDPEAGAANPLTQKSWGKLPIYFVENNGQTNTDVAYYLRGRDKIIYFTPAGITFLMTSGREETRNQLNLQQAALRAPNKDTDIGRWAVKVNFVGANPNPKITGEERTPAVISYFTGPIAQRKTGIPTFASIHYHDLWPGIDVVFSGTVNELKYAFYVTPGADPTCIGLAYSGADILLDAAGQIQVSTPLGGFTDKAPTAYQIMIDENRPVDVRYTVSERGLTGFRVGPYDRSKLLIIDPAVVVYSGYIGGSGDDLAWDVAVDYFGNAYVVGQTESGQATFPAVSGPDLTYNGMEDAFIAKVNSTGTGLVYAGFIGGSQDDKALGVAVDASGNAYVIGNTGSSEATFPVVNGPDLTYNGGSFDAFIAKVNSTGTALVYAGFIGGLYDENAGDVAVDGSGNAYVVGDTRSNEDTFPVIVGPDLTLYGAPGNLQDAFVAKVNASGTALEYCGYIGGSVQEIASGVAVDGSGNAYVVGYTQTWDGTFPSVVGPDLTYNGSFDAFITKVNATGTSLLYSGFIGGSEWDDAFGVAVDSSGNAYVAGRTQSTEATFPTIGGPDLTHNGMSDAFIAKVNATGTSLQYAGFIGGSGDDWGRKVAVDSSGIGYVVGYTDSTEATFPVVAGPDLTHNGMSDAFVAKVNPTGTELLYAGYIGGSATDYSFGVAIDGSGSAYVAGATSSTEASFPVVGGLDPTANGNFDAFVVKLGDSLISCLFCDDFEDSILDPNWTYSKPSWTESGGTLIGTPTGKKAVVVGKPVFAGCSECSISSQMRTDGGAFNKIWLLGWYADKRNTFELLIKQEKNIWILRQRLNGVIVSKTKASSPIVPGAFYDVSVSYTGGIFTLSVDGAVLATLPGVGNPSGTVGFQVKNTTGRFGQIVVN